MQSLKLSAFHHFYMNCFPHAFLIFLQFPGLPGLPGLPGFVLLSFRKDMLHLLGQGIPQLALAPRAAQRDEAPGAVGHALWPKLAGHLRPMPGVENGVNGILIMAYY